MYKYGKSSDHSFFKFRGSNLFCLNAFKDALLTILLKNTKLQSH